VFVPSALLALVVVGAAAPSGPAVAGGEAPAGPRTRPRARAAARGNSVLARDPSARVITAAASVRMGVVVGGGDVVVRPPLGFGFGLKLAFYLVRLGPMRFGPAFHGGHDRFPSRRSVVVGTAGDEQVTGVRWSVLSHTDLALGPHFQVPAGPVFVEFGAGGGLGVSSYRRAVGPDPADDDVTVAYDPQVRADLSLGIPIRNNQGLAVGVDLQKYFSKKKVVTRDPDLPAGSPGDSVVFDLILNVTLAYQMWF
jgi:hypothetical protein